jgi:hypothetical protein
MFASSTFASSVRVILLSVALPALLSACGGAGTDFIAKYEPWRSAEEQACLASGAVHETGSIRTRAALGGPSVCGTEHPFEMSAADNGRVSIRPAALVRCPMIPQIDRWVATSVQPAAQRTYGVPLAEVVLLGSYSCRPMNNIPGSYLSEHGHANAIDVGGFVLADGRKISVMGGWRGDWRERAFLHSVHDGACESFTTVLSPDYDSSHHDHLHLDLARRGSDGLRTVCK